MTACTPRRDPVTTRSADGVGLVTEPGEVDALESTLREFVGNVVAEAGADRAVVALDGGLNAAVTATVAADALGSQRITGLVMPVNLSHAAAARSAERVAEALGIDHTRVHLQPLLTAFQRSMDAGVGPVDDLVATENARVRFQTTCAYYVANASDGIVVGTSDRTDLLTGSVVKHGDTGADCLPLGDLYRTEVRELAGALDVPADIGGRSTRAGFSTDGTERDELDLSEEELDRLLHLLVDRNADADTVAERLGVAPDVVGRVASWCTATRHKRRRPPTPTTHVR